MIDTFNEINNRKYFGLRRDTRLKGNSKNINRRSFNGEVKRHAFNFRVMSSWNNLPEEVASSEDVKGFKTNIENYMSI